MLPMEESLSEPETDDDDSGTSFDEAVEARGLGSKVPSPGALAGGPRS
jgi:hypothetical protein